MYAVATFYDLRKQPKGDSMVYLQTQRQRSATLYADLSLTRLGIDWTQVALKFGFKSRLEPGLLLAEKTLGIKWSQGANVLNSTTARDDRDDIASGQLSQGGTPL